MGKIIDSLVQGSLDSKAFTGVILAKMHFSPVVRYCSAYQNIYWDESGGGDVEYIGLGNLASMSTLGETGELQAQTIQLTLSGIPNAAITDAFSTEYAGKPVYLWYATLDTDTYAVEGGQDGPVLVFAGSMDYINIEFGETCTLTLNCTSRLADWERSRGGRFNQSYQQRYVDPGDTGFNYVQALQNAAISWGGVTIADPGSGGRSGGGGCFVKDTMITMADNSKKKIQDVVVGDKIFSYNPHTYKIVEDEVLEINSPIATNTVTYYSDNTSLSCTPDHPLYLANKGWSSTYPDITEANYGFKVEEIKVGNKLRCLTGGNLTDEPIITIYEDHTPVQTYNLHRVKKNGNFFANSVLVHNKQYIDWD